MKPSCSDTTLANKSRQKRASHPSREQCRPPDKESENVQKERDGCQTDVGCTEGNQHGDNPISPVLASHRVKLMRTPTQT
eukprot:1351551-Amphidinium_carterae.1